MKSYNSIIDFASDQKEKRMKKSRKALVIIIIFLFSALLFLGLVY